MLAFGYFTRKIADARLSTNNNIKISRKTADDIEADQPDIVKTRAGVA